MNYSNFHTHTVYCDGKNTPEELVLEAIRLGCPKIGFSGHSYIDYDESYCMSIEGTAKYKSEILSLKEKYKGRIDILLGVEQDYYSNEPTDGYEYVIGSVHAVKKGDEYLTVDLDKETQLEFVSRVYGGDFYSFCEDYYELVSDVYNKTKCDIVGHFDLVTKFNEGGCLFDTSHPRYKCAAKKALDSLLACPVVFEINYGAMAMGYRTSPYPEGWIIDYIKSHGGRLMMNSDCHDARYLLYGFPTCE